MKDFILIMPELIIALTLAFVVIAEITYHGEQVRLVTATALFGLCAALLQTVMTYQYEPTQILGNVLCVDGLSLFFKLLFITLAALAIIFSTHTDEIPRARRTEYSALILASTLGMCLAASSADMLLVFLSLQFLNILSHFLTGYGKRSAFSIEAAVKYMVFSGVAGALLLYGLAVLFSSTHSLNLYEMHRQLLSHPLAQTVMLVAFMLVFLALSFQIGSFPMYLWTPDVLQGAPTPAAAFLSVGSRAVGFAVAIRFLIVVFAQPRLEYGQWQVLGSIDWTQIMGLVSGLTMVVGSLLALQQRGAKRMVACLVIVQTGFLLMGLLVLDQIGVAAILYNLVIELFALVGTFYVLAFFYSELKSDRFLDLRGILSRTVPECICLVLFLLCLVGFPPTPGFLGKFTLIGAVVRHHWTALAALAILAMAISTIAIARLAFHLIGDLSQPSQAAAVTASFQRKVFLLVLVVPMFLSGIFAEYVLDWAGRSLGFILW